MKESEPSNIRVVKSTYYSNWGDLFGYPIASFFLPFVTKISFLTPNVITILAFLLYTIGSLLLFIKVPSHLTIAAILIPLGFIGDDLDGQVARTRKLFSIGGDYLDKVLDILKIFIITFSLGISVYEKTGNILYVFLAFTACFFFNYRYYIKLETMFSAISRDQNYLERSAEKRKKLELKMDEIYSKNPKNLQEWISQFMIKNRTIFFVDEAEFAIITGIGALFNILEWSLWILAISQVVIALWRFFERRYQLINNSPKLFEPMRK